MVRPADFPPPFRGRDFVAEPTDPEDERIDVGVLVVGGGPAGLACAIRFGQLLADDPATAERLGEVPLALIEKGKQPGSHLLSGAVVNPRSLKTLLGDKVVDEMPNYGTVPDESVYVLTKDRAIPLPLIPPTMRNHGNVIVSLSQLGRWLAEQAEEGGAMVLPETAAERLLVTDGAVVGVRTGDKGRGVDGEPLRNYEPGSDMVAKVTVLAEGTHGHLTGVALDHFDLHGDEPQVWELGVKEIWRVPKPLDRVIHTMGWPLRPQAKYPRVRRRVHLSDGRRHGRHRHGGGPGSSRRRAVGARLAARAEDAPEDPPVARRRRTHRVGREDHPRWRLPCAAKTTARTRPVAVR